VTIVIDQLIEAEAIIQVSIDARIHLGGLVRGFPSVFTGVAEIT
jgi:hypothetical protein